MTGQDWLDALPIKVVTCQEYYLQRNDITGSYTLIAKLDGKVYACQTYDSYKEAKEMLLRYRSNNTFYKLNFLRFNGEINDG